MEMAGYNARSIRRLVWECSRLRYKCALGAFLPHDASGRLYEQLNAC